MLFFYVYLQNQLNEKETEKQAKSLLEVVAARIDNQLEIAFNLREQLKRNEEIIALADSSKTDYYNVLKVYKQLSGHLDAFSKLGYMIGVSKPDSNMMITPQHTIDLERYLREKSGIELPEELKNLSERLRRNGRQMTVLPEKEQGKILLYTGLEEVGNRSNRLIFYLWFTADNILPELEGGAGRSFYIMDKGKILLFRGEEREYQFLESLIEEESAPVQIQTEQHMLFTQESKVTETGWIYGYLMDKREYTSNLEQFLRDALFLALLLLAGGLGLAVLLSRNIYKPVHDVARSLGGDSNENMLDNEWEYILNRTKEMQESARQFKETIVANQEKLKIQFLRELSLGLIPQAQLQNQLHSRILGDPNTSAVLTVLQYHLKEELARTLTAEGSFQLRKQVLQWLKIELAKELCFEMFEYSDKRAVLLIPDKSQTEIIRRMSEAIGKAEEIFKVRICAIVGEPVSALAEIPKSFQSVLNIMEYEFLWDNYTVVTEQTMMALKNETYYYPLDIEKNLIDYVLQGKSEEVHAILDGIFEHNFEKKQLSPETLSKFIFAIVSTSNRILHRFGNLAVELNKEKELSYIKLKMYHSQNELKQAIYELFDDLLKQSAEESERRRVDIVDEIIAYLKENYALDLSLNDIAERFHLSAGYVGILFKKSRGENFKDYFNQYKIEKAKEILRQENIKIKDLAERVGCNSTSSFIRIFKKYAGVSPGQYAENVRGEWIEETEN